MFHRLRKLNYNWNHKRVYRVYKMLRLNLRDKRKKRLPSRVKEPLVRPIAPNVTWSIDFMHDNLINGKTIRTLNVMDDFNREILSITVDTSLPSKRVVRELEQLTLWKGKPERIRVDNGPEFIAQIMKDWCKNNLIQLTYIQPGKPTQNSLIEIFNRTFRTEVLNVFTFSSIKECNKLAQAWMWMYNNQRQHSALNYLTPHEFLNKYANVKVDEFYSNYKWNNINLNVAK